MRRIFALGLVCLLVSACSSRKNKEIADMIIPQPYEVEAKSGFFNNDSPKVSFNGVEPEDVENLGELIKGVYPDAEIIDGKDGKGDIDITLNDFAATTEGSYVLNISRNSIEISARQPAGLLYAIETVAQLKYLGDGKGIACMEINDIPRFGYRGMHLDVSRHFFDTEFIKKQLDVLAFYKINRFHWHLTDGAGWRIEIKKYPELTEKAAWRPYKNWKEFWFGGRRYCKQGDEGAHGGYYTQEEIKDVVAYAQKRGITVIPEIEMPGHSEEVLAVYPELSCSGRPYVNVDLCPGNEKTFEFLENVLSEVIELFPSEYIHIGGDEADKGSWKKCPKCQARMRNENLKNVDELQSYLIKRIEQFLGSKGRKLIGWDEIMQGGLSPYATVMSWRSEEHGIKAAEMGHDAIMVPGGYCYFDYYQDNPITEPEAIGGYLPMSRVYSFNPVPDSLDTETSYHIKGVQANLWTEYIPTEEQVEYMIYPRILALAEVGWSVPENKSWDRFLKAANRHLLILDDKGINAHRIANGVNIKDSVDVENKEIVITLSCDRIPSEVRYTTDGTEPETGSELYTGPIIVKDSINLKVAAFVDGERVTQPQSFKTYYHKGIGKKATYNLPYCENYTAAGEMSMTDGCRGGASYSDGRWQGFRTGDMDIVIDLGEVTEINEIEANFMQQPGPWIWFPVYVDISVSDDGKEFRNIKHIDNDVPRDNDGTLIKNFGFNGKEKGRYIRYYAHQENLDGAYMFIDEIIIK